MCPHLTDATPSSSFSCTVKPYLKTVWHHLMSVPEKMGGQTTKLSGKNTMHTTSRSLGFAVFIWSLLHSIGNKLYYFLHNGFILNYTEYLLRGNKILGLVIV